MTMRLNLGKLAALPDGVHRPAYDPSKLGIGIVHMGLGAFHRAHQAVYTDDAIAASGGEWGICAVSLKTPTTRDQLAPVSNTARILRPPPIGRMV